MSYSIEFRREVLRYCSIPCNTILGVAELFNISPTSIVKWKFLLQSTGSLADISERSSRKISSDALASLLNAQPDLTQQEMADHFNVDRNTVSRALKRLGYTRKKNNIV